MTPTSGQPAVRVLVFTGKGGVGKTTTAAATAARCASIGHRTLVVSTDVAHSLADVFDVALGDQASEISERLWAEQLDPRARLEASWGELRRFLADVLRWAGVSGIEAEELSMFPGLDEVVALSSLRRHVESGRYDVIVVDAAPTAETVRLLSLPDVLSWWIRRALPVGQQVVGVLAPLMRAVTDLPIADAEVFGAASGLGRQLAEVRALLTDESVTSIRLVVNPERVVVAEAKRTLTYLSLFGYHVDAVVANRLLPDEVTDPWFAAWRATQHTQLAEIESGFAPLPVLRAPLTADEPVGLERLAVHAHNVWGDTDPRRAMHHGPVLTVEPVEDRMVRGQLVRGLWRLVVTLPFAGTGDVNLRRRRDELIITIGSYRRAIVLPDSLRGQRVTDAVVRNGRLEVEFAVP